MTQKIQKIALKNPLKLNQSLQLSKALVFFHCIPFGLTDFLTYLIELVMKD